MVEWKKGISKQGRFPTKAFSGILTAMYPSENAKGTGLLQLDFADEIQVGIYGTNKAKITDDSVEVGGSLAEFQASLELLGWECSWGVEGNEILGFKAEKDGINIAGNTHKLWMKPLEEQVIGDDTQTKKSIFWGLVEKVERIQTQLTPATLAVAAKPGKLPKAPKTVEAPKPKEDISGIVIDALDVPKSISELFTGLAKKYKVSELREALDTLKESGMISENNGKWSVI